MPKKLDTLMMEAGPVHFLPKDWVIDILFHYQSKPNPYPHGMYVYALQNGNNGYLCIDNRKGVAVIEEVKRLVDVNTWFNFEHFTDEEGKEALDVFPDKED